MSSVFVPSCIADTVWSKMSRFIGKLYVPSIAEISAKLPFKPFVQLSRTPPDFTSRSYGTTRLDFGCTNGPLLFHIPRSKPVAPHTPGELSCALYHPEVPALETRPFPWHERLGSPIVFLSRLQTSPDAATGLVSPCLSRALATTLATATLRYQPEVCYPALPALTGAKLPPPGEIQRAFTCVRDGPTTDARIRTHHDNNIIL